MARRRPELQILNSLEDDNGRVDDDDDNNGCLLDALRRSPSAEFILVPRGASPTNWPGEGQLRRPV